MHDDLDDDRTEVVRRRIDRFLWRERLTIAARASIVLIPAGIFFGVLWTDSWTETRRLHGVVVGFVPSPPREHGTMRWVTRLPDGRTEIVESYATDLPARYREGLEILVVEQKSRLLPRVRYRYAGPWPDPVYP